MDRRAYETMAETEDRHWWFVGRRRIIERQLEALSLPRDTGIIEVGAGTGGNLARLRRFTNLPVGLSPLATLQKPQAA